MTHRMMFVLSMLLILPAVLHARQGGWSTTTPAPIMSMSTLHAQDANTVLIAGENRTVIRSTDAGATWTKQHFQIAEALSDVRFMDGSNIWIAGSSGALYKSTDGGSSWFSVSSGTTKNLYAIAGSGGTLCAVGFDGKIVRSTDGGNTWSSPLAESSLRFYEDIHFLSATTAVIVGSGSSILRTTDGGVTWASISLGISWVKDVSFANNLKGWAVGITATYISITDDVFYGISTNIQGKRSSVWKTTDGGQTWGVGVLPTTNWLDGVHFVDTTTGWAVGEGGAILKTSDGGTTWTTQVSGTSSRLASVSFSDNQNGIVVGPSGMILRTTNGGGVWTAVPSGTTKNLNSVALFTSQLGMVVGEGGTILKTTDGGASWQSLSGGDAIWLYSMRRIGNLHGWVAGTGGTILKTTDGGITWLIKSCGTADYLAGLAFTDAQTGWAIGYNNVFRTDDGGNTWTKLWTSSEGSFKGLWFSTKNDGWIVGYKGSYPYTGMIKKTTDGGYRWSDQVIPAARSLWAIHFVDGTTGFAVGDSGKILRTTNGGNTWSSQESGTTESLSSIGFASSQVGWIIGQNSTILKTTNGGASWGGQKPAGPSYASFACVSPVSESTAWIAGHGVVLRTTDGGGTMMFTPAAAAPAENALGVPTTTTFRWASSPGAVSYRLQLCKSTSFSTLVLDRASISDTSSTVTTLESNARYYWRVRAEYSGGSSAWSKARGFETIGITWRQQSVPGSPYLYAIHFPTATTGWAVGMSGTILKTTNGGGIWNAQNKLGTGNLNSVFFVDSLTGWVVGSGGQIYSTRNAGSTWVIQSSGITSSLERVRFLDANIGWVAGDNGNILRTTDGGATWLTSSTGSTYSVGRSVFPVSASVVWAVDPNGIYKSTNGGAAWSKNYTSGASDVFFANPRKGWALANRGVYRTTDGGAYWMWTDASASYDLNAMSFVDSLRGWAVGYSGVLVYTADGGNSWQARTSGTTSSLYGISFINDSTGWAAGGSTILKATTKPGVGNVTPSLLSPAQEATSVSTGPTLVWNPVSGASFYRVQVCRYSWSDSYVWLDSSGITATSINLPSLWTGTDYFWRVAAFDGDGPSNWSDVWKFKTRSVTLSVPELRFPQNGSTELPQTVLLQWGRSEDATSYRIQVSTAQSFGTVLVDQSLTDTSFTATGLSAGALYYWRVLATGSVGTSAWSSVWSFTTLGVGPRAPRLLAPEQNATGIGNSVTFRWTRAATAVSYRIQLSVSSSFTPIAIDFTLTDTSYAVSSLVSGTVYFWRVQAVDGNGAGNWSDLWSFATVGAGWKTSNVYGFNRSISFVGKQRGWVVGGGINATTDGGSTWKSQWSGAVSLESVWFVDSLTGWSVGSSSTILKTVNGGNTWGSQISGVVADFRGVSMSDANNGWAVAEKTILRTTNGGATWTAQTAPVMQYIYGVRALSSSRGIVFGGGLLLRTTDGGATWTSSTLPGYGFLLGAFFLDQNTGWVVGADGVMFKTTDGGAQWGTVATGTTEWITSIHFAGPQVGWAVGWNGLVLRTTDAGTTWGRQLSGVKSSFYGVHFVDALNGWVVGGQNIKTTDGGGITYYAPVLKSPALNAVNVSTRPVFQWEASAGCVSYQLQVATSSYFSSTYLVVNDSALTSTTRQTTTLAPNQLYYWRVLGYLIDGGVLISPLWNFRTGSSSTSVESLAQMPETFSLEQNYPNPFNPSTTIQFDVPKTEIITLKIYNTLGYEIETLFSSTLSPGRYSVTWNATHLSSGVYFCRMQAGEYLMTKKLVLLK